MLSRIRDLADPDVPSRSTSGTTGVLSATAAQSAMLRLGGRCGWA